MRFTISKREFAKHIGQVLKGISTKKDQPILKNFLIEAKGEVITITSSNQLVSIQSVTEAQVEIEGKVCVDAKLLDGLLKKIKLKAKEDVFLTLYIEGNELAIDVNGSVINLKTANVEEFPVIEWIPGDTKFELECNNLSQGIKQVSTSTAKNESRPILSGVLCHIAQNFLTMVSTDGHRMSSKILEVEGMYGEEQEVIIPVDSLIILERILSSNKKAKANTFISDTQAIFDVDGVQIQTGFIKGNFINYKKIFGMPSTSKIIVEREPLLEILERASIFIPKDKVALVSFKAEDDLLKISISSDSGAINEILDSNMTGSGIEITFNVSYLITGLKNIEQNRVTFNLINNTNPMIVEGVGNKAYKYMLLPIKSI